MFKNNFAYFAIRCITLFCIVFYNINAESTNNSGRFYNGDYDCGYAEVRKGAFLFWWLYYAGGDKTTAFEKPFIIWIQGGPGNPASALGNFMEIGPQDVNQNNRTLSWVHKRNVLFIDSPVGTGFSYYTNASLMVKSDDELTKDLVELMKQFLKKIPKFETVPTHIFSQSYGGKIAPRFAYYLHKEIQAERMKLNLKSVGLGSSYVSPKDCIIAYAKYLYIMGFIDQIEYKLVAFYSHKAIKAYDNGSYVEADDLIFESLKSTPDVMSFNIFNVLKPPLYGAIFELLDFMNNVVKRRFLANVIPANITFECLNAAVSKAMVDALLVPSVNFVEKILNETKLTVVVYNGNLDSKTPITAAMKWVHGLNWHGAEQFRKAPRQTIGEYGNGDYKSYGGLSFWCINNAGHSVGDNLEAMEHLLNITVDSVQ